MRAPLWLKLTLAGLLVEALMLSLLVFSNVRLIEEELINKTQLRVSSAIPLLNAALATPLMQRAAKMPMSIWYFSTRMGAASPPPVSAQAPRCQH
jgi:hypothetical protein